MNAARVISMLRRLRRSYQTAQKVSGNRINISNIFRTILLIAVAIIIGFGLIAAAAWFILFALYNFVLCIGVIDFFLDTCPEPRFEEKEMRELSDEMIKKRNKAIEKSEKNSNARSFEDVYVGLQEIGITSKKAKEQLSEDNKDNNSIYTYDEEKNMLKTNEARLILLALQQLDEEVIAIHPQSDAKLKKDGEYYESTNLYTTYRKMLNRLKKGSINPVNLFAKEVPEKNFNKYFTQVRMEVWYCYILGEKCGGAQEAFYNYYKHIERKDRKKYKKYITRAEKKELINKDIIGILDDYYPLSLYYGLENGEELFQERIEQILEMLNLSRRHLIDTSLSGSSGYITPVPIGAYRHNLTGQLYGDERFRGRRHAGVDFAGDYNVPIFAANSGVVVTVAKDSATIKDPTEGMGNYIVIEHPDGLATRYMHLNENTTLVKPGDTVQRGQVIAGMGTTGNSTGPHLHIDFCAPPLSEGEDYEGYLESGQSKTYSCSEKHTFNPEMNPINLDLGYKTRDVPGWIEKWVKEFENNILPKSKEEGKIFIVPGAETLGEFTAACETNGCEMPPKYDLCVNHSNDAGGLSCGPYQISTGREYSGTMNEFLNFLKKENKKYYNTLNEFDYLTEESEFVEAWKKLDKEEKYGFRQAQFNYVYQYHYTEIADKVVEISGFDPRSRSMPLQEIFFGTAIHKRGAVWSKKVQPMYGESILSLAGLDPIPDDFNQLSDEEITLRFIDAKITKYEHGEHNFNPRFAKEKKWVKEMYESMGEGQGGYEYIDVEEYLELRARLLTEFAEKNADLDRSDSRALTVVEE